MTTDRPCTSAPDPAGYSPAVHTMRFGRMTVPDMGAEGVTSAPGPGGVLVSRHGAATMVVEAYAIPRSGRPWHDLCGRLRRIMTDDGSLSVHGVKVLGRDSGRVLARAYLDRDDPVLESMFASMGFLRGPAPMEPMAPLPSTGAADGSQGMA